jgi:hypothetical protein
VATPGAAAIDWTTASLLATALVLGIAIYLLGLFSLTPGVGGNVLYEIALVTDVYFLFPAAITVPLHWLMLRRQRQQAAVARLE